jgi:hypothetical protein
MFTHGFRVCRIALVVLAAVTVAACSSAAPPERNAVSAPRAEITFVCLWWSEAQMEGLNPNAPPPKTTEVQLAKWEYSDPVGVPHPDTIDVVVTLANTSDRAWSNLVVEVAGEWNEGPLQDAAHASWSQPAEIKKLQNVSVGPAGRQALRVPVDLKAKMDSLRQERKWPYGLRVTATVRAGASTQPLTRAVAELPIKPGD